ncbi:MAG TPA: hypothetical protein VHK88_02580 [Aquihabitans sp.]|nr:hypothetical protein [Aquihabitans sp.]
MADIFVVPSDGQWRVEHNGHLVDDFGSLAHAVVAARLVLEGTSGNLVVCGDDAQVDATTRSWFVTLVLAFVLALLLAGWCMLALAGSR